MIPVSIKFEDIKIRNAERNDINNILLCINESKDTIKAMGRDELFSYQDIEERYIETLINPLEFFCVIEKSGSVVGIIKGRIERKEKKCEALILSFIINKSLRRLGIGTKALNNIQNFLISNFSINLFSILTMAKNVEAHEFWERNGYNLKRVTESYNNNTEMTLYVFEKIINI